MKKHTATGDFSHCNTLSRGKNYEDSLSSQEENRGRSPASPEKSKKN